MWTRGAALASWNGQPYYSADGASWLALPWPTSNGVQRLDSDAFTLGTAAAPTSGTLSDIAVADWDIPGSFQAKIKGDLSFEIEYQLRFDVDPPTDLAASLATGHGISLWKSGGSVNTMSRLSFTGLEEFAAIGQRADCPMRLEAGASETGPDRYLLLHRIPSGSVIGTDDDADAYLKQIKMEALVSSVTLKPAIRWTG